MHRKTPWAKIQNILCAALTYPDLRFYVINTDMPLSSKITRGGWLNRKKSLELIWGFVIN